MSKPPDHPPEPRDGAAALLSGRQLLVLQLLARGYTPGQIAALAGLAVPDVLAALEATYAALGAHDWCGAVAEERRRALIV